MTECSHDCPSCLPIAVEPDARQQMTDDDAGDLNASPTCRAGTRGRRFLQIAGYGFGIVREKTPAEQRTGEPGHARRPSRHHPLLVRRRLATPLAINRMDS